MKKRSNRNPKGGKGYRGSRTQQDRQTKEIVDTAKAEDRDDRNRDCWQSEHNDWRWYALNDQLVVDYASFPYGVALGTTNSISNTAVPGVMALYYAPCVGTADGETSALNIAARRMYSWVRHANSGHSNYESPDLMMYMLAVDSCYMYLAFLQRLYGVMNYYIPTNRYVPKTLVQAMGVDFDDILLNLNDLRGYINNFALRLSSMAIPNSVPYMARHAWMASGLYTDSSTTKAQIYLYVPTSFYLYTNTGSGNVGALDRIFLFDYRGNTPSLNTFKDLTVFGNDLLNPIITTEALNIMSGDIIKAYGMGGIVTPTTIPDNYIVLPTYSQEVLSQFENATMLGMVRGGIAQDTSVGGGYLKSGEYFELVYGGGSALDESAYNNALLPMLNSLRNVDRIINMHHDGVTPAETMVATRCTNVYTGTAPKFGDKKGTLTMLSDTVGSEAVQAATMFAFNKTLGTIKYTTESIFAVPMSVSDSTGTIKDRLINVSTMYGLWASFDWAPSITLGTYYSDAPSAGAVLATANKVWNTDYDNYTIVSPENLRNMSRQALLSEFWVPAVGG